MLWWIKCHTFDVVVAIFFVLVIGALTYLIVNEAGVRNKQATVCEEHGMATQQMISSVFCIDNEGRVWRFRK